MSGYSLEFLSTRDRWVEDKKFPSMVAIYVEMAQDGKSLPPTQRAFTDSVLGNVDVPLHKLEAARARVFRAYSPMVQQHHFGLVLAEIFDTVAWDLELDMKHGIDLFVESQGQQFGFSVSVQTERADYFKSRKAVHYDRPPFPVLDVKIQPRKYQRGRFWLYDPRDADELRAFVEMNTREAVS